MNNIFVVSGPSGSGKTTLIKMLREKYKKAEFSVSVTTREKRPNEVDGRDYYFVTREQFKEMEQAGKFVEWFNIFGNMYATTSDEILKKSSNNRVLILDVDINGASALKKKFSEAFLVFIEPPDQDELRERLVSREGKNGPDIKKRLRRSIKEISESKFFDVRIINDDLKASFNKLDKTFLSFLDSRGIKSEVL